MEIKDQNGRVHDTNHKGWDGCKDWFTLDNYFYQCGVTVNIVLFFIILAKIIS